MSAALSLAPAALALDAWEQMRAADPLAEWEFNSTQQRDFALHFYAGNITYIRSGNSYGKTEGAIAALIAIARGDRCLGCAPTDPRYAHLTPIPVPQVRTPSVWYILTKSYDSQLEGSQQALLKLLGNWPHRIAWNDRAKGIIAAVYIKPRGEKSDDPAKWSRIRFRCQQSATKSLPGGRINGALADEPPDPEAWREVCARQKLNQVLYLGIAATPLNPLEYEPLMKMFDRCEGVVRDGKIELRASIDDNRFLTPVAKEKLRERWKDFPDFEARWNGEYVNVISKCPYLATPKLRDMMKLWKERALRSPGIEISREIYSTEDHEDGRHVVPVTVRLRKWWNREPDEIYMSILDPSLGIDDPEHDPAAVWLVSMIRPRLIEMYCGALPAWGLGYLGGLLSIEYANAEIDIDRTGGYGESCYDGARQIGAVNFAQEVDYEGRPKHLGFKITPENRGALIAASVGMVENDSAVVLSVEVVNQLRHVVVDPRGKIQAVGRHKDEHMICLGRWGQHLRHPRHFRAASEPAGRFPAALAKLIEGGAVNGTTERRVVPAWR